MGTVIFPEAAYKVFLTASAEERAVRRHKQLKDKGLDVTIATLLHEIQARDARDRSRSASPMEPAQDALLLDNSHLSIEESVDQVLGWWQARQPFHAS